MEKSINLSSELCHPTVLRLHSFCYRNVQCNSTAAWQEDQLRVVLAVVLFYVGMKTYSGKFSCNSGSVERSMKKLFCKTIQSKFKSELRNIRIFFSRIPSLIAGNLHLVPDHLCCFPPWTSVYLWFTHGSLDLNWKKYWTKTTVELNQRKEIPLCLINLTKVVEVRRKRTRCCKKIKKKWITLASRLGIHGCGERREDFG